MTQSTIAKFPLFVELDEPTVVLVKEPTELGRFEQIDIENNEYRFWDSECRPLEATWKNGVCFEHNPGLPEPFVVLDALRRSAAARGVEVSEDEQDPLALLSRIGPLLGERS